MSLVTYRQVLALPGVFRLLAFSVFARIPHAATSVVMTLYVVLALGKGYAAAGLVVTCVTAGGAIGAPWRGRALDRMGLRRTVLPSVIVEGACWAAIPLLSYRALLPVAFVAGLMNVPTFTVVRQSIAVLARGAHQGSAFALDSIATEMTYMIAPAAGVVLATTWSPPGAVWILGGVSVIAGTGLWLFNPPTRTVVEEAEDELAKEAEKAESAWSRGEIMHQIFSREMIIVLGATVAALAVLAASEVGVVAYLREHHQQSLSSLVFILWSASSIVGGLVLGARRRPVPVFGVLLGLGLLTIPVGLAPSGWWLLVAILPTGFFCAPSLTATAAAVSRLVPERIRGEAMGWYGTAITIGLAAGAPLAGWAIDRWGPWAGFALIGTIGVVVAVVGLVLVPWGIDRPDSAGSGAPSGVSPTRRLRSVA